MKPIGGGTARRFDHRPDRYIGIGGGRGLVGARKPSMVVECVAGSADAFPLPLLRAGVLESRSGNSSATISIARMTTAPRPEF